MVMIKQNANRPLPARGVWEWFDSWGGAGGNG